MEGPLRSVTPAPESAGEASRTRSSTKNRERKNPTVSKTKGRTTRQAPTSKGQGQERRDVRSWGGGSMVWTILLLGLFVSVVDVVYVIWFVGRQTWTETSQLVQADVNVHHNLQPPNKTDPLEDKGPIISLLKQAGIDASKEGSDFIGKLPRWSEVVNMYGDKPVIHGLDQCERFQQMSDPGEHLVSTAGTFNSGTNLMAELLIANCHMQARMDKYGATNRGVRWQVPWGKHTPPADEKFRRDHKTTHDADIDANSVFPAVTIRDPLTWLSSMCHHPYTAKWDHEDKDHCPDFSLANLETKVSYAEFSRNHKSILHLWNDYYEEYLNVSFPRLLVRFEDLVFHPEEVTRTVCECAGGSMRQDGKFMFVLNSAKKGASAHGKDRTGYVDAIVKYGSEKHRYQSFHRAADLEYIRDQVSEDLMRTMGYPPPDPNMVPGGDGQ